MKRLALALALVCAAPVAADEPPAPPPWMPAPRPGPRPGGPLERHVRQLRHDAAIFGVVGLALFGAGVAVDVVALDVPQGERSVATGGGLVTVERYRDDANWAEFALGTALLVSGFGFFAASLVRITQARRLEQ